MDAIMSHNNNMVVVKILNYSENAFTDVHYNLEETAEDVCERLSRNNRMKPISLGLFGLKNHNDDVYLWPGAKLQQNVKYEFRMRYKVSDLSNLNLLDTNAVEYLYCQIKYDLVNDRIPELRQKHLQSKILGLGISSMYYEMLLNKDITRSKLTGRFKEFFSKKMIKKHNYYLQFLVRKSIRSITNLDANPVNIRELYISDIMKYSPNYLVEIYNGHTRVNGKPSKPVKIAFMPPSSSYSCGLYKQDLSSNEWEMISTIEEIYAIIFDKEKCKIDIDTRYSSKFTIQMKNIKIAESVISCITQYYRLLVNWSYNLCDALRPPSLARLVELKCHGPVSGPYTYEKLKKNQSTAGSYTIRQCSDCYNVYYIDMIVSTEILSTDDEYSSFERIEPSIFTYKILFDSNKWFMNIGDQRESFDDLTDVAKFIPLKTEENNQRFLLPPTEHDKPTTLLLCLPPKERLVLENISLEVMKQMRVEPTKIINQSKELRRHIITEKLIENGKFKQMNADWIIKENENKIVPVTLKILECAQYFSAFVKLSENWGYLSSPDIIKLYGITLSNPFMMVTERVQHGTLDEFLKHKQPNLSYVCRLDAVSALAKALTYLQNNGMVHGYVRCSTLSVVEYKHPSTITVRLSDPGFHTCDESQIPWVATECYDNIENVRTDMNAEKWAFATTVWELFTNAISPDPEIYNAKYFLDGNNLPRPENCPVELYRIMCEGWQRNPLKRFHLRNILHRLLMTRDNPNYLSTNDEDSEESDIQHTANLGIEKNERSAILPLSLSSNYFNTGEMINERLPYKDELSPNDIIDMDDNQTVTIQRELDRGNFGVVYQGIMESINVIDVAIKKLRFHKADNPDQLRDDFKREIQIMRELEHPNIVKIFNYIEDRYMIVMEFVSRGSLINHLRQNCHNLKERTLIKFSLDIAKAMEYLSKKNIIHRDLAARNVLVDSKETLKLSDFGLSQLANKDGYYTTKTRREIPYKWYAPEVLKESSKYSIKSDVWSYGVTLFEIFSLGREPDLLTTINNNIVHAMACELENGKRLARPEKCSEKIYQRLIMPCWELRPMDRPKFSSIIKIISDLSG